MRLTLRLKWTLVVLAMGVLPLLVAAILVGRIQREGLFRAEQELESAVVDEATRALALTLEEGEGAVHRAAVVLADSRIEEEPRLLFARDAINAAELVASVAIYDRSGGFIGAIEKVGGSGARPELPPLAPDEKPEPRWVQTRMPSGELTLRFLEPVLVEGTVTAWVVGAMRADVVASRVVELSRSRFVRVDRLYLVDRQLRIVAGDAAAWPVGRSVAGQGIFAKLAFDSAVFATAAHTRTTLFTSADGTPMVGTVRTMPKTGWAVAVERPEAEAFAALAKAVRAFWFAALGVGLVAFGVGAAVARRTTQPIRELVALTRAYGKREFMRRNTVHTHDELEELGTSLGTMADDLASGEAEIRRRATVEAGLARYLPAEVASAVADGTGSLELGGRRADVSVLFADAAAFTTFAERASPERVVELLNELFTVLSEVVYRHGGMVDKFMGDCIMAVFGAHGDTADHVARALAAAEDMHRFVEASSPRWKRDFDYEIKLGIGLSTGAALVGNLGSEKRMEFTAVGDSVNVASRLETLARPGQTLVTAEVAREAGDAFEFHSLGAHPLRGKAEPVEVLEVVS
jgi:adenylate cyclase